MRFAVAAVKQLLLALLILEVPAELWGTRSQTRQGNYLSTVYLYHQTGLLVCHLMVGVIWSHLGHICPFAQFTAIWTSNYMTRGRNSHSALLLLATLKSHFLM